MPNKAQCAYKKAQAKVAKAKARFDSARRQVYEQYEQSKRAIDKPIEPKDL